MCVDVYLSVCVFGWGSEGPLVVLRMMQSKINEREKSKERQTEKKKKLPSYFHGFYLAETLYSGFGFHLTYHCLESYVGITMEATL